MYIDEIITFLLANSLMGCKIGSMNYIVLDLEWNQCPYGKQFEIKQLPFEIIEIGAIRLTSAAPDPSHLPAEPSYLRVEDTFREIIAPQVYKKLHHRTQQVVHLTDEDFRGRRRFVPVIRDFLKWCGPDPVFCIWGSSDLTELQRNLAWYGVPSPFPFPLFYCNVQKIYSILYEDRKSRRSLSDIVDALRIPVTMDFHDAFADAYYTAQILCRIPEQDLLCNTSVDYYRVPSSREEEYKISYPTYDKYVFRSMDGRMSPLHDKEITSVICPVCGKTFRTRNDTEKYICKRAKAPVLRGEVIAGIETLKKLADVIRKGDNTGKNRKTQIRGPQKKIRWRSSGSKNYITAVYCPEDGWVKGKIRVRPCGTDQFFTVKTHRIIPEEEALGILSKMYEV